MDRINFKTDMNSLQNQYQALIHEKSRLKDETMQLRNELEMIDPALIGMARTNSLFTVQKIAANIFYGLSTLFHKIFLKLDNKLNRYETLKSELTAVGSRLAVTQLHIAKLSHEQKTQQASVDVLKSDSPSSNESWITNKMLLAGAFAAALAAGFLFVKS